MTPDDDDPEPFWLPPRRGPRMTAPAQARGAGSDTPTDPPTPMPAELKALAKRARRTPRRDPLKAARPDPDRLARIRRQLDGQNRPRTAQKPASEPLNPQGACDRPDQPLNASQNAQEEK